jgi:thiol-disulfide isomerase/thioredoxin
MAPRLSLRALLLCTALVAGVVGIWVALSGPRWTTATPSPRSSISELVLPDVQGRSRALTEWAGKTRLVNFWATWCAPCREEIPLLEAAQAKHAGDGLQVIGVAIDDPDDVVAYLRELRIEYPVLLGDFSTLALTAHHGNAAQVLPFTVILAPTGQVLAEKVGSYQKSELDTVLQGVFSGTAGRQ